MLDLSKTLKIHQRYIDPEHKKEDSVLRLCRHCMPLRNSLVGTMCRQPLGKTFQVLYIHGINNLTKGNAFLGHCQNLKLRLP